MSLSLMELPDEAIAPYTSGGHVVGEVVLSYGEILYLYAQAMNPDEFRTLETVNLQDLGRYIEEYCVCYASRFATGGGGFIFEDLSIKKPKNGPDAVRLDDEAVCYQMTIADIDDERMAVDDPEDNDPGTMGMYRDRGREFQEWILANLPSIIEEFIESEYYERKV